MALALYFVVISGDSSVMFLFVREKFSWTLRQYTLYNSATNIMWMASKFLTLFSTTAVTNFLTGTFIIVYLLHHRLRVTESRLILVGFVALAVGAFVLALARVDWLVYVGKLSK